MDEVKRWVNLSFVFIAILLSWLLVNFAKAIFATFSILDAQLLGEHVTYSTLVGIVLAVIVTIIMYRNISVYDGSLHVAREMRKVTWPNWDETKYAMKVVIATSIIVALILFGFDIVAKELTALILGIS
ncbi:MAG: preprotein translocase subunit SecE [Bradymonadales bacterium]|jgi:preprotein translocase SecE subunit